MPDNATEGQRDVEPGYLRIVGNTPGGPLAADDCIFEVMQDNGEWLKVRGVCWWKMNLEPGKFADVDIHAEIGAVCLKGIPMDSSMVKFVEANPLYEALTRMAAENDPRDKPIFDAILERWTKS